MIFNLPDQRWNDVCLSPFSFSHDYLLKNALTPKIIIIRIERGEIIKDRRERGEGLFLVFGLGSERSDRVWRRRGSEEGEAGRRVQEVQTQTPRSGFTNPRRKVREEPNAGVRSQIPRLDFVVYCGPEEVPEKVQVSRDVDP
ncbi:hypothetical protein GEV33_012028 [Tenebrio molitor]|uniref:Uncharacterized protein n=1 Tax=Tenebrio molitor TaxID=7067 RepID=A0A8J6HA23_TENMO|nr:hypothetical protein GEV33_012028 [Tenebrio molitor]